MCFGIPERRLVVTPRASAAVCRAFACTSMEDCYPAWGNLLPGLLKDDVPAHLWLREKTGRDLNLWQYWAENPALEEQFSTAMTEMDLLVR